MSESTWLTVLSFVYTDNSYYIIDIRLPDVYDGTTIEGNTDTCKK